MQDHYDVVIVGTGHAGAQAAISLRQKGYEGSVALLGDERVPPYERPPLSKEYLAGEKPFERILLRPENFWGERDIELLTGKRVVAVDAMDKSVTLSSDEAIGYDKLIWAAGGSPRMIDCPGSNARNLFAVRRRSDVDRITERLDKVENITVIGGGYIGLEAAAIFTKLGKSVTVVESRRRVLARVAGRGLSAFYEAEHRRQGVKIITEAMVNEIVTDDAGEAKAVALDNGDTIQTDMIICGIGIIAETGPLIAAGAIGGDGVDVDGRCRTSLPDIYAIGDCAAHANKYADGAHIRLESVQNANDQAKTAAADIMNEGIVYDEIPWFWSNQYDLKLQTVGLSLGYDTEIIRGDPETREFSVAYLRGGKLVALDCVNRVKDYVQGRKAILEGDELDQQELADPSIPIKEVSIA
ncbi:FAD-dependent oxidoreductase [Sphingorhabdus sp. Alg239-R122]|uniref:NAD(P)/FAD-dependent oxidoreductase n=1 Tax=Sphingorhabdus sp. Alg239-R122 TaxID=2305989 RepID=UPI0013DC4F78|nr:FAD-dependent oxidoreductase [Sphingorhabdus sp. Alg239-R122]